MNYLLDTCTVSDFFKKVPSVVAHFQEVSPRQVHISAISVMEIEYGLGLKLEREKKIRPIWEGLRRHIQIVPFSTACAVAAASIRADLKSVGLPVGAYDLLIAGTALAHSFVVVSSNLREFQRISAITTEDWRV